jgi:hypothetical protein
MASNVLSMGKTALEITAPFVPIPALVPAVDLLLGLVKLFENVTTNRCVSPICLSLKQHTNQSQDILRINYVNDVKLLSSPSRRVSAYGRRIVFRMPYDQHISTWP